MKTRILTATVLFILLISTSTVQASTVQLYTVSGFVTALIEQGIIPSHHSTQAKEIVSIIEKMQAHAQGKNAKHVAVTATHYIEYGTLEYNPFEDIKGLLVKVSNTSDEPITLEAGQLCPVTYTILQDDRVLYESATQPKCNTQNTVTYTLKGDQSRLYEVIHEQEDYQLNRGVYRFLLEYPGYGSGSKTITIK